ncbi:MAG: hypothetical protein QW689_04975 [Nitrososphaerota archaeon]
MTEFGALRDTIQPLEEIRSRASGDRVIITDGYLAYDSPDSIGINHSER